MSNTRIRSIEEIGDIYGMRVIVRASLDIPLDSTTAADHFRVRRSIPTIKFLIAKGARVIIMTHIGRDPMNSTLPLIPLLLTHFPVVHAGGVTGEEVFGKVTHMKEGSALLLENLRALPEEEDNDPAFAKTLASYGNFYVNDAFAVSHRAHASIVGIPQHLPSFAGITFMEEYNALRKAFTPEHPSLFILGGAKYETKEPLIAAYSEHYTNLFIGGALANDFLKGKGYEVGESLVSPVDLQNNPVLEKQNIILPIDVVAVRGDVARNTESDGVAADEKILDVGPQTVATLAPLIYDAKTILWNGPLGNYEGGYDTATKEVAKLIAESDAFSIVGGGDTIAAIEALGLNDSFSFLSTAGGAMLEFLEQKTLPGITALEK